MLDVEGEVKVAFRCLKVVAEVEVEFAVALDVNVDVDVEIEFGVRLVWVRDRS